MQKRISAALKSLFIADSLAMPVHWYYNTHDIFKAFDGGVRKLHDAPARHPSSIMSLHSTSQGGRKLFQRKNKSIEVIGDIILKGKRQYWNTPNLHYHHMMKAGDNTLNAHCARVVMRHLHNNHQRYNSQSFLNDYIDFMTADPPRHNDTYAESYHRGFFSNYHQGKPPEKCGAVTHDTASIGGLVTIAPIVMVERYRGTSLEDVQSICYEHLYLTHPDQQLAKICNHYVRLLDQLLCNDNPDNALALIQKTARDSVGVDLNKLENQYQNDADVIGRRFSSACYIDGSWPGVLFLAHKYLGDMKAALIANANLGGDNVHRGSVLGVIIGLMQAQTIDEWFNQLINAADIEKEINNLF